MVFYLATKNEKKLIELKRILSPLSIDVVSEKQLNRTFDDVDENGNTFEENALIKARAGCRNTGLPSIADDSGLCVDALSGAPGIYSARYSGKDANDEKNIAKLLLQLKNVTPDKRTARFITVVACVFPDGREFTVKGVCEGRIATEKHGTNGFGYDPVFISKKGCFGEISMEEKDKISHRGKALAAFAKQVKNYI